MSFRKEKFTNLSQLIGTLDEFTYILKKFRVSFHLYKDDSCMESEESHWTNISIRGNRVGAYHHDTRYLMVWLEYEDSKGFGTKCEGFKDSMDLTLLDVIRFCEEYHRRVFLLKEEQGDKV